MKVGRHTLLSSIWKVSLAPHRTTLSVPWAFGVIQKSVCCNRRKVYGKWGFFRNVSSLDEFGEGREDYYFRLVTEKMKKLFE